MHYFKLLGILLTIVLITALFASCETGSTGSIGGADAMDSAGATAPILVGTPGDEVVDNACYLYTPQIVEDTFRYLDEIYIEKYPQLGLRWEHGTGADQRIMTAFAQQITEGCATDAEKVAAIVEWIVDNIRYKEHTTAFSYDVLYEGYGNCLGKAMLMQDMCRVVGIPAVFGDGFRGNMKTFSVEDMQSAIVGHAWCYVYVDGEWFLYDPAWGVNPYTDLEYVAETFYMDTVGGVTPIYDENNMPPFRSPQSVIAYMDSRFIGLSNGEPNPEISGYLTNDMSIRVEGYTENDSIFYLDGPASFICVEDYVEGELYTNGWITVGDPICLTGTPILYLYENAIQASETVLQRNGEDIYFFQGTGHKLFLPQNTYRIRFGYLNIHTSYQGMVFGLHSDALPEGHYEYQWSTSDSSIATIDENGVVTCHGEGIVDITLMVSGVAYTGIEEVPINELYCSIPVKFSNDISRPAEYAALDPGGSAAITQTDVPRIGNRDIYPIMTDDMLMMFEPQNGVITLPTAQNANGYFIMPETYESALQVPYHFELPLAEGSILLDRNKLKEFTLVNTEQWGEMWYLPLNEKGVDAFGPGASYQPGDVAFGNTMIPTNELYQNGKWKPQITDAIPENGVISTQLLPVVPELPEPNYSRIRPNELQYAIDQGCALEIIIQGNSMKLDTAAMQTLLCSGEDDSIMFWFVAMKHEWCAYSQQILLQRMATVGIYDINFDVCGTGIHDLLGGTATVTVPLGETGGTYGVYFVDAYGNLTEVSSTVNGDGTITFVAPYFSTYAIIDISQTPVN